MLSIATAECFTHGKIGTTIHKIASGYNEVKEHPYYPYINGHVKVMASMFIPLKYSAEKLLNIKLPIPDYKYEYAKAYSEKNDLKVSYLMAKGVKDILNCDISIGTTAGVGRGGICILTNKNKYVFTTDVYGDLINGKNIIERQKNGIKKTLDVLVKILKEEYNITY
ncbi:UPF0254 family protein [Methanothermococcus okinawensis]|uniref:UPF0254 protein Metok_1410 n=1 Tax=Methanothermococcus okinawensis (strain DSM 14208 / JCM 11175 / IH1) TaxID=647113 RepID=F8ALU0_METOI|nr:UPF0254 family protein [Methanothermococcus okinawensis]AEH07375.1 UPF0254 protein [Methanothermococcus okinawensis IH1]